MAEYMSVLVISLVLTEIAIVVSIVRSRPALRPLSDVDPRQARRGIDPARLGERDQPAAATWSSATCRCRC